ncbi:MAG: zinc-binding dehydrogenase [Myxococcota bacterium]|nr:zinc-binding dehydrogenase [Myxococcota bacterium]
MRAITIEESGIAIREDLPKPSAESGSAVVRIQSAALNRRDHWISVGMYPKIRLGSILGSDGCGIVEAGSPSLIGTEVLLCPSINWGENERHQSPQYTILGMPQDGCFADYISVPSSCLHPKPKHLKAKQAAALPLAGLTAWRALFTRACLQSGERILITGIGGGVSLIALQLAIAAGAEVYITSSSKTKIDTAIQMGARGGFNYTQEQWYRSVQTRFDVILDSAGGPDFDKLIRMLNMGGRLVFIGGTRGKWPSILPQHLFFKQASLMGSTMGSPSEFAALCSFVEKHNIQPVIDSEYPLSKGKDAFERLLHKERMGKVILSCDEDR